LATAVSDGVAQFCVARVAFVATVLRFVYEVAKEWRAL
jgi:hypothetical protein